MKGAPSSLRLGGVTAWTPARRLGVGAEIGVAALVAVACFVIVAVAVAVVDSVVLVSVIAIACLAAVTVVDRVWDIAYAVPVAIASLVAFDWFELPPTHPHALPDAANAGTLLVYLAGGVLVGRLAASAARRAEAEEAARRELFEEQSALRRVATLVARESPPAEVFAKVAEELSRVLGVETARVVRYEPEGGATVVGNWAPPSDAFAVGTRLTFEGGSVTAQVHRTRRPARVDDYELAHGVLAGTARAEGYRSGVGAPIVVDGRLWGVMIAMSLPPSRCRPAPARQGVGGRRGRGAGFARGPRPTWRQPPCTGQGRRRAPRSRRRPRRRGRVRRRGPRARRRA